MNKHVTLSAVAIAAGVSKATASNVFNWPQRVRPVVRLRVEAAANRLGYFGPDPKGRLLSAGKTYAIGVVMPGSYGISIAFRHPYMRDFLAGVTDICEENGTGLVLVSGIKDQENGGIKNALVDGFILGHLAEMDLLAAAKRRRLPIVVMDSEGGPDVSSVRIDDHGGAMLAAQHLIDLGHRRFAIVSTSRLSGRAPIFHSAGSKRHHLAAGYPPDMERLSGVAEVLASVGIAIDDVPIIEINSNEGVAEGAALLLDSAPDATAILCIAGDPQAIGILAEARRRNIVVPDDLSVVGFDDNPEATVANPPLTTVMQPVIEKGQTAARILFEKGPVQHVVLPVTLVIRSSTAKPRKI